MKSLQAPNFAAFRKFFLARLQKLFLVPATSFDNVRGCFPIGFFFWDTDIKRKFKNINSDIFDRDGHLIGKKRIYANDNILSINRWIKDDCDEIADTLGVLYYTSSDFQQQNTVNISSTAQSFSNHLTKFAITKNNLIIASIYFAVRKVIPADWLNDRDQFLYPNDGWKADREFRNDCLAYTLFHGSNNIQSKYGINHWIPFTENEVSARSKFESNFMINLIAGKIERSSNLFTNGRKTKRIVFSPEAKAVFKAGRKIWTYYHSQPKCNVNASLYDIREYFQGRDANGKMNNKSNDETYNTLIADLRSALKILAAKIKPKVYEYGFLKK